MPARNRNRRNGGDPRVVDARRRRFPSVRSRRQARVFRGALSPVRCRKKHLAVVAASGRGLCAPRRARRAFSLSPPKAHRARAAAPSLTRPALDGLSPRLPLASVQVIEVTTSKTGKHGHAKCHFTATDIFTGKKMEELVPSSHNLEVPIVSREDYTLVDLNDEGFLGLMDDSGNVREDLKLPAGHDDAEQLARQIQASWDEGKELVLTVLKSMNQEQVNAQKEAPKSED